MPIERHVGGQRSSTAVVAAVERAPASSGATRVLIVSEVRLYREGLAYCLGRRPGLAVVATPTSRLEALADVARVRPDLVLLDMTLPESLTTAQAIVTAAPHVKVVALGIAETDRDILACAEAGIVGYVARDGSLDDLVATMQSAAHGELRCSPRIAGALLKRLRALITDRSPVGTFLRLTSREQQVAGLLDTGMSNKEIARRLGIEAATVKNHVHNIIEKLHVRRRGEAAAAIRNGGQQGSRSFGSEYHMFERTADASSHE